MPININISKVTRILLLIVLILSILHIGVLIAYFVINDPDKFGFVKLVDMDYEGNLPTLFSTVILMVSSALFLLLARVSAQESPEQRKYWLGLAGIFMFLGVDEGAKIHEKIGDWFEQFVNASDYLYYPWVLPYVSVLLVLVLAYLKFYLKLPRQTQTGMLISAVMFLTGAVVLDMIGGNEADQNGTSTIYYSVLYTIEEILEMLGVILLIHTLLKQLQLQTERLTLVFK